MEDDWRALLLALCAMAVGAAMILALTGCADECAHLYCAPGDPAIEAYKAAEREGI